MGVSYYGLRTEVTMIILVGDTSYLHGLDQLVYVIFKFCMRIHIIAYSDAHHEPLNHNPNGLKFSVQHLNVLKMLKSFHPNSYKSNSLEQINTTKMKIMLKFKRV